MPYYFFHLFNSTKARAREGEPIGDNRKSLTSLTSLTAAPNVRGEGLKPGVLDEGSGAHTLTCISWVIQNSQKFQKTGLESVPATRLQPELSMRVPLITAREWKSIAPHLPPSGGPGKPRSSDRLMLSGLFYSEACRCSLEIVAARLWQPAKPAHPPAALEGRRHAGEADESRRAGGPENAPPLLGHDPRTHTRLLARLEKLARILGPRHHAETAAFAAQGPLCR